MFRLYHRVNTIRREKRGCILTDIPHPTISSRNLGPSFDALLAGSLAVSSLFIMQVTHQLCLLCLPWYIYYTVFACNVNRQPSTGTCPHISYIIRYSNRASWVGHDYNAFRHRPSYNRGNPKFSPHPPVAP